MKSPRLGQGAGSALHPELHLPGGTQWDCIAVTMNRDQSNHTCSGDFEPSDPQDPELEAYAHA